MKKKEMKYNMKENIKMKNFDDVLEFLSDNPEHIISQLKRKKNFIKEWINVFLNEKPIVEATVKWTASQEHYPSWTNELLILANEICQNCQFYTTKCTSSREKEKCLNNYFSLIDLHISRMEKTNSHLIKDKMKKVLDGVEVYVSDKQVEYTSEINSGKFDTRKIRERLRKLYEEKNNCPEEKNKIIRDMKRYVHEFPLLKTELDRDASYFEDKFNDIIRITENHTNNYEYRKIQRSAYIFVSLFYLFFWDFLNKTKLRDTPNAYEVQLKTDERVMWVAEHDIVFRPNNQTPEEVEEKANQTKILNYDPSYKQTHFYLFEHDIIPIEKIFDLAKKINELVNYYKLSSISYNDFPYKVKCFFETQIKKKNMLRTPLRSDGLGNQDYRKCKKNDLKRYFTYKSYILLFTFLSSALDTTFRVKKPSIPRSKIELLIKMIRQEDDNLSNIIKRYNIGEKSTVMDFINNNIEDHPKFEQYESYPKYGKAKIIILEATEYQNSDWLDKIYSDK